MSQYRLHIDIPLGTSEPERSKIDEEISAMNYRLGHDDDRQKSNYLMIDNEGHVNNKKCRLTFNSEKV